VFLKGMSLNDSNTDFLEDDFIKAIMIDQRMLDDPFIRKKIHGMIKKRIEMAAKGSILLKGNFAIVSGDPYSLAQSIFGLPVTGLLKPGEVYHKYWLDQHAKEIACFRAPMTCHNNIRKRRVVHNEAMDFWYQYITTGIILNSWDTTCDALNGADKDSDAFFTTNNEIILKNTRNSPTIECIQRKAEKIIPTESDLVQANKLAFGDEIGPSTNRITSMTTLQSMFEKDTEEFKALNYRIMCGQLYQQNSIDKTKGILAKSMPEYWYDRAACRKLPDATEEERKFKELCFKIVADKKPYFMRYVYPDLMAEHHKYKKDAGNKCVRLFRMTLSELLSKPHKSLKEQEFAENYQNFLPVGNQPCTVNRICTLFEAAFQDYPKQCTAQKTFDYSILKSNTGYGRQDYKKIEEIKSEYDDYVKAYQQQAKKQRLDKEEVNANRDILLLEFRRLCEKICPDPKELCDILIDMCYSNPKCKKFAWDICETTIIENLLKLNSYVINYPVKAEGHGEFEFSGEEFIMCKKKYREDEEPLLF
jgi:hypothetical protein